MCHATVFAFSLRLHAALHLACSTCIDATASDFDGMAARPPTSMTLPRCEVVEVATAWPRRTSSFFEGAVSSFLDAASSFPDISCCFLDDAPTRNSNPAHLLLALTRMAASSTTTRLLLDYDSPPPLNHDGLLPRRAGMEAWQRHIGRESRLQQRRQAPPLPLR
jgi:hypothetical protein